MAVTPSTTSLRGQETKYFFYRSDLRGNFEDRMSDYTKDIDSADTSELQEVGSYVTTLFAADLWRADFDESPTAEQWLCMTYNPITDQYSIRPGEYVL